MPGVSVHRALAFRYSAHSHRHTLDTLAEQGTTRESWWHRWRRRGPVLGLATIVATVVVVLQWVTAESVFLSN